MYVSVKCSVSNCQFLFGHLKMYYFFFFFYLKSAAVSLVCFRFLWSFSSRQRQTSAPTQNVLIATAVSVVLFSVKRSICSPGV